MNFKLFFEALFKYVFGLLIIGLLLFLPGTFSYWQGWLFIGVLFIPMFILGMILMIFNPDLLKRRLNNKEKENEQKGLIGISGLMFISGFIIAGLNYRFEWFILPNIVTWISSAIFIVFYILYAEVLRENSFLEWRCRSRWRRIRTTRPPPGSRTTDRSGPRRWLPR